MSFRLLADGTSKRLLADGSSFRLLNDAAGSPGFTISPTAGHTAGPVTVTVQYTGGAICPASMPISIQSGGGSVATWVQDVAGADGSGHFTFIEPAASGTPTVFLDSVTSTTRSFDNSAIAPGVPTIGTAVKGNASAQVPFTAPADNGGSTITSYVATSTPGSITGTLSQAGSGTITVSGLTNGTAYTFTVHAVNAVGSSSESSASNAVTPSTVPSAPTIGTASALNASALVPYTANSNGGATITKFVATSTPGSFTGELVQAGSGTITVSGLTNGVSYTFTVHAVNANGNSSESSASNSVTPSATFNLFRRTPYLTTDTLGTKSYQLYDGDGNAIGSAVTTGFVDIGDITNAWWVLIPVSSNDGVGGFNGLIRYANINGSTYAAEELNSRPPTAQTSFIICKKAPFLTTDTVITPQYKIYDSAAASWGSWITAGIWAIPGGPTNGYAAKITRTADSRGGVQDGIKWYTG